MYVAVDRLCITIGARSQMGQRCRSKAISIHTALLMKVFIEISNCEMAPTVYLSRAEFAHDR